MKVFPIKYELIDKKKEKSSRIEMVEGSGRNNEQPKHKEKTQKNTMVKIEH